MVRSGIALAVLLALIAFWGSGYDEGFGFTIPERVQTLPEAIDYMEAKSERTGPLYTSDSVDIEWRPSFIAGLGPDFGVTIRADTEEDAYALKRKWADEFRALFNRWDVCEVDIGWFPYVKGVPITTGPADIDLIHDPFVTPGCDGPARERWL